MQNCEENKGITVIALVITIIVLLILSGVTVVTLTGENGLLEKANSNNTSMYDAITSGKELLLVKIGLCYEVLEDNDSALRYYKLAQKRNEDFVNPIFHIGCIYDKMNKSEEALEMLEIAYEKEKENVDYLQKYGDCLVKSDDEKKISKGILILEKGIEFFTGNIDIISSLAKGYEKQGRLKEAISLLEKAQKDVTSELTLDISTTKVTVVKIDSVTKQPLAGATLVLKDSTGKELTRWDSTTKAHVIKNLANGTYRIEEIKAPDGYKLNTKVTEFTITDSNRNIKINIENAPKKVVINVTKVDQATREAIPGAVLVMKDAQGQIIYKWTSTNASEVITDVENGTYTIEEVSAPEGYIKSDKVITFTIDDNHLSHQITFENAKEVYVPDTASVSSMIMMILGIVITGLGLNFVYKNGQRVK